MKLLIFILVTCGAGLCQEDVFIANNNQARKQPLNARDIPFLSPRADQPRQSRLSRPRQSPSRSGSPGGHGQSLIAAAVQTPSRALGDISPQGAAARVPPAARTASQPPSHPSSPRASAPVSRSSFRQPTIRRQPSPSSPSSENSSPRQGRTVGQTIRETLQAARGRIARPASSLTQQGALDSPSRETTSPLERAREGKYLPVGRSPALRERIDSESRSRKGQTEKKLATARIEAPHGSQVTYTYHQDYFSNQKHSFRPQSPMTTTYFSDKRRVAGSVKMANPTGYAKVTSSAKHSVTIGITTGTDAEGCLECSVGDDEPFKMRIPANSDRRLAITNPSTESRHIKMSGELSGPGSIYTYAHNGPTIES